MQSPLQGKKVKMRIGPEMKLQKSNHTEKHSRNKNLLLLKACEELLDINFPNSHGLTPLMLAVRDVDLFESLDLLTAYRPDEVLAELLRHHA